MTSESITQELERLRKENDILRGIAAKVMPCHYCGVDNIGKCPHGFPGCSLMDDVMAAEDCMAKEIVALRTENLKLQNFALKTQEFLESF